MFNFINKYGGWFIGVSVICLCIFLARPEPIVIPEPIVVRQEVIREVMVYPEEKPEPVLRFYGDDLDNPDDYVEVYHGGGDSEVSWATTGDSITFSAGSDHVDYDNTIAVTGSSVYFNPRW